MYDIFLRHKARDLIKYTKQIDKTLWYVGTEAKKLVTNQDHFSYWREVSACVCVKEKNFILCWGLRSVICFKTDNTIFQSF